SSLVVIVTIPLALLSAVVALWVAGQTINIMTLGGLALAVGVLVDEATVEIENIHTHVAAGIPRARAVVEACRKTVAPRLLSVLSCVTSWRRESAQSCFRAQKRGSFSFACAPRPARGWSGPN